MKALLVAESDAVATVVEGLLAPLGFDCIRYRNPVKALDNLEEIDPDALIVSARDFPRHWKPLAQVLREGRSRERTVIILLKGESFDFNEAAKAMHIGVNGVVEEGLSTEEAVYRFQDLLKRYKPVDDARRHRRYAPQPDYDRFDFMFNHPASLALVTGLVTSVSEGGLSFVPDDARITSDLVEGMVAEECSFRAGNSIISVDCELLQNARALRFAFRGLSAGDSAAIVAYIGKSSERALDSAPRED